MNKKEEFEEIAKKFLHIETLETRNRDSLDFHQCSVWGIENALKAAYELGKKDANKKVQSEIEKFDPHELDIKKLQLNITKVYGI